MLHEIEPLLIYAGALAALAVGLLIERAHRHPRLSAVPPDLVKGRPERRHSMLYSADILMFGALVAIIVHLILKFASILGEVLTHQQKLWSMAQVQFYSLAVLLTVTLMYVYLLYSKGCRRADEAIILRTLLACENDKSLFDISNRRLALHCALTGIVSYKAVPGVVTRTNGQLDREETKRRLVRLAEEEIKARNSIFGSRQLIKMRNWLGILRYFIVSTVWFAGALAILHVLK